MPKVGRPAKRPLAQFLHALIGHNDTAALAVLEGGERALVNVEQQRHDVVLESGEEGLLGLYGEMGAERVGV